eukprot:11980-Heterococcus_DN1.PRE.1
MIFKLHTVLVSDYTHTVTLYDAIVASRSEAAAAASLTKNCSRWPCDSSGPGSVTLPSYSSVCTTEAAAAAAVAAVMQHTCDHSNPLLSHASATTTAQQWHNVKVRSRTVQYSLALLSNRYGITTPHCRKAANATGSRVLLSAKSAHRSRYHHNNTVKLCAGHTTLHINITAYVHHAQQSMQAASFDMLGTLLSSF